MRPLFLSVKIYVIALLSFLFAACNTEGTNVDVLVVLSQEEGERGAADLKELLPETFSKTDQKVHLSYLYLNQECDSTAYLKEVKTAVDSRQPDLVMLYGKPALCSYLKYCAPEHPERPAAFAGVISTEAFQLSEYPSIKGFVSRKYFYENLQLIHRLFGNVEIALFYDHSPFRQSKRKKLLELIREQQIGVNAELLEYLDTAQQFNMEAYMKHLTPSKPIQSAYLSFWPVTAMSYQDNLNYIYSRKNSVYLSLGRLLVDINLSRIYSGPVMTTENFEMGHESGVLGGYFPTLETEVQDWVSTACDLLAGNEIPQVRENRPDYVFDYREMEYLNLTKEQLPEKAVIINRSLDDYYGIFLFVLFLLIFCLIIFLIFYGIHYRYLYRIQQVKIRQIKEEQEWEILACLASGVLMWLYTDHKWSIQGRKAGKIKELDKYEYTTPQLLERIAPEDRKPVKEMLSRGNVSNVRRTLQFRLRRTGSDLFLWHELEYVPSYDDNGEPVIIGFSYSIQDYKNEERILQENRMIIEKAELKQSFLMNMTNEIRLPMTRIVDLSTLLSSPQGMHLSPEERKAMNYQLKKNVDELLRQLDDILQISHIKTGEIRFTYEYYEVNDLLKDLSMAYRTLIRPALQFTTKHPQERMRVRVDRIHLSKIISILLSSADKYTPEGYVELGAYYDEPASKVVFYVKDSGVGIPEDKIGLLFAKQEEQGNSDSTMLELSLCEVIARKMGGQMSVESKLGEGCCFYLYLPCQKLM